MLGAFDMPVDEFERVCDRWTNKKLFKTDTNGQLVKEWYRNLNKQFNDNV